MGSVLGWREGAEAPESKSESTREMRNCFYCSPGRRLSSTILHSFLNLSTALHFVATFLIAGLLLVSHSLLEQLSLISSHQ